MSPERKRRLQRHAHEEVRAWIWGVVIAAIVTLIFL